jgi:hypothetical protein
MRTMMKIAFPVETGNDAIKGGNLQRTLGALMERLHPEAAYFFPENGRRTCLMVFDLKNPSDLPTIVEPLFTQLNASVDLTPVMNADDLKKGLGAFAEAHAAASA